MKRQRQLFLTNFTVFQMNGTVGDLCQSSSCVTITNVWQTVTQIKEQLVQLFLIMRIQTSGRLIRQHHRRMIDERTGNGNPLLLATGQLIGLVRSAFRQSHEVQYFGSRRSGFLLSHSGNESRYHYILQSRKFR